MSEIAEINTELTRLSRGLEAAAGEFDAACRDFATKRSVYELARAHALLRANLKTAGEREAQAVIACEAQMRDSRIAEAIRDSLKERIRSLQSVLNATQTRAAFLKEEMRLSGREY